jgi:hypothetical protein
MDSVEVDSRERVQIRMRESGVTMAAWRVSLKSHVGAIILAEVNGKSWYRGEGNLLGLPQERLAELWTAALAGGDREPDLPQYG